MCLNSSDTSYSAPALKDGNKFLLPKIAICSLKFFVYDDLSAFFSPLSEFRRCCEKRVGRGIERCLHGILDDSDDEADADDLHGHIVGDAEQTAGERNQEQRTAGNAGSAACGDRCDNAQHDSGREVHIDSQSVCCRQRHDIDRDRRAFHIDSRAQRDRDGVIIFVQIEGFAQLHIYRNICSGTSRKESGNAAFFDAFEHQRIWIFADAEKYDQRIEDQGHGEHGTYQKHDEFSVFRKDRYAAAGDRSIDETEDSERRQADNAPYYFRERIRNIDDSDLGGFRSHSQSDTDDDRPGQDADVVGVHQGGYRIVYDFHDEILKYLEDSFRGSIICDCVRQSNREGKNEADDYRDDGGQEGSEQIEQDDDFHAAFSRLRPAQRTDDQKENEDRRNRLQSPYEQIAQNADRLSFGNCDSKDYTEDKSGDDPFNQTDAVPL